jgi:hypothetical protein
VSARDAVDNAGKIAERHGEEGEAGAFHKVECDGIKKLAIVGEVELVEKRRCW